MQSDSPILKTEGLTKRYGSHVALDALTLTVRSGEVFGYIGPNGAGKTTTFRILSGLLDPTEGKAYVAGQDVTGNRDLLKQLVGFLPDNFGIYPTLRVSEYLDFFAAAYKVPAADRSKRIDYCLQLSDTTQFRDKQMGALSRGMRQRVGIAKTLLHDPQLLILDEPVATVDPRARVQMRKLLRELAGLGKAVLVSSHILPELADVCDTVGILSAGKLIASGPVQEILRQVTPKRVIEISVIAQAEKVAGILANAPGQWTPSASTDRLSAGKLRFECVCDEKQLAKSLFLLLKNGIAVGQFHATETDLEDVFMTLTDQPATVPAAAAAVLP